MVWAPYSTVLNPNPARRETGNSFPSQDWRHTAPKEGKIRVSTNVNTVPIQRGLTSLVNKQLALCLKAKQTKGVASRHRILAWKMSWMCHRYCTLVLPVTYKCQEKQFFTRLLTLCLRLLPYSSPKTTIKR